MSVHKRSYTMEELWGTPDKEQPKRRKNKLYCIYLGNRQYVAINQYGWFAVTGMENAEIFSSLEEAEIFLRSYWIEGEINEWFGPNKEYLERM